MATITYDYGPSTTRNQPISPELERALLAASQIAGVDQIIVGSGGQTSDHSGSLHGHPGGWTGSTRHDDGGAGDIRLVVNGRVLDFTNPNDQAVFSNFVSAARQNGATGIGAGTDYLGSNTIHVGFGSEGVWGAGGAGANAPDWLSAAYYGAPPAAPATRTQPASEAMRAPSAIRSGAATPFCFCALDAFRS